mmetsp:Transcript_70335/g.147256  ORF Transcript_70335/g.147256 Transcript_70335/m.147256 type:complete len:200 (-) Transcript_70335:638-1237(-)
MHKARPLHLHHQRPHEGLPPETVRALGEPHPRRRARHLRAIRRSASLEGNVLRRFHCLDPEGDPFDAALPAMHSWCPAGRAKGVCRLVLSRVRRAVWNLQNQGVGSPVGIVYRQLALRGLPGRQGHRSEVPQSVQWLCSQEIGLRRGQERQQIQSYHGHQRRLHRQLHLQVPAEGPCLHGQSRHGRDQCSSPIPGLERG